MFKAPGTCGSKNSLETDRGGSCLRPSMCQSLPTWLPPRPSQDACPGQRPNIASLHLQASSGNTEVSLVSDSAVREDGLSSSAYTKVRYIVYSELDIIAIAMIWMKFIHNFTKLKISDISVRPTCRTTADVTSEKLRSGYGISQQYISHKQMPKLQTSHFLLYGLPLRTCQISKSS